MTGDNDVDRAIEVVTGRASYLSADNICTVQGKKMFVAVFAMNIVAAILEKIERFGVPEDWNAFELRQLVADLVAEHTLEMDPDRREMYESDRIAYNL